MEQQKVSQAAELIRKGHVKVDGVKKNGVATVTIHHADGDVTLSQDGFFAAMKMAYSSGI